MENTLFTRDAISKTLTHFTPIKGAQGTALTTVAEKLVGVAGIMVEGKCAPAYLEYANLKIVEAQLAVNQAIEFGWNGGNPAQY